MNMLRTTLLLLALAGALSAQAQDAKGQKLRASCKEYLEGPKGRVLPMNCERASLMNMANTAWLVFPDRDGVQPTATPGGAPKGDMLKRMSPCWVIDETETHLHVVEAAANMFDAVSTKDARINKPQKDYGWVAKNQLLLWRKAIVSEDNVVVKGIVVSDVRSLEYTATEMKQNKLKVYADPSLSPSSLIPEKTLQLYTILYILKVEGDAYLVSTANELKAYDAQLRVFGWVNKSKINIWKTRLAMDQNPAAAEERKKKNVDCLIFKAQADAENYGSGQPAKNNYNYKEAELSPTDLQSPYRKRLPIFNYDKEREVFSTGYITDIKSLSGDVVDSKEYTDLLTKTNAMLEGMRKINIVFVMDGSPTTAPYKTHIVDAAKEIIARYTTDPDQKYQYSFGGVVYRDFAEKTCPQGDIMIEQTPDLSSDYGQFLGWLSSLNPHRCKDKDRPQALFAGLERAAAMLSGNEKRNQNNVIILLGGGGDRNNDPKVFERLQKMIASQRISLVTFQLQDAGEQADINFRLQMKALTEQTAQEIQKDAYAFAAKKGSAFAFVPGKEPNTYRLPYQGAFSPIPGYLVHCEPSAPFDADKLEREMQQFVNDIVVGNNQLREDISNVVNGFRVGHGGPPNAAMLALFQDEGIPAELINKLSQGENVQYFVPGYAVNKHVDVEQKLYKPVIFMTSSELSGVKNVFQTISGFSGDDPSSAREKVRDAFKEMLTAQYGKKEMQEYIKKLSGAELMQKFTGLPVESPIFYDMKNVDCITSARCMSDEKIRNILGTMSSMYNSLENLTENENARFKQSDNTYYWVPREYLP